MKRLVVFILISCGTQFSFSQLRNNFFKDTLDLHYLQTLKVDKHKIHFAISGLHYNKNNEYFYRINPGQTFFGTQLQPKLLFKPDTNLLFETGLLINLNYGDPKLISNLYPIIKMTYVHKDLFLRLGSLQSHVNHGMPDPLLNYESVFTDPVEYGIQTIMTRPNLVYESWNQWKQNVDKKTVRQEIIIVGQSLTLKPLRKKFGFLHIPIQAFAYHKGGQAIPGAPPLINRFIGSAGLQLNLKSKIQLESYYMASLDKSQSFQQPFNNGMALMENVRWFYKKHEFVATYWYSREFVSTLGAPMFSNISFDDAYLSVNQRQLFMLRWNFTTHIIRNKVFLDARFEPYYDITGKKIEFSHGFHVKWNID